MSNKPTHIVIDGDEAAGRNDYWRKIGAIWQHRNGDGFALFIPEGLDVTGRIVCTRRKEKAPDPQSETVAEPTA